MSLEIIKQELNQLERGDFKCTIVYSPEHFEGLTAREVNLEVFEECLSVVSANDCILQDYSLDRDTEGRVISATVIGIKPKVARQWATTRTIKFDESADKSAKVTTLQFDKTGEV